MKELVAALRIDGDSTGAKRAVREVSNSLREIGASGPRSIDPFTESVARATGGVEQLATRLNPLNAAVTALFAGFGVSRLIDMAGQYGQMNAQLRLATQYTGDFAEVQAALRQAAEDTRAPLAETVGLYARLAPSLVTLGRTGSAAVGVITTVNKAIALSGASSGASQAALVQFGQALGSGVLRGDELNSILEQTPGLADAIAEGLGVARGELRRMGEQGELTAQRVVEALERVAGRVDADFKQLPLTIGQATTLLNNQLTEIVGSADQGSGALSSLARAIVFLTEGIENLADSGETLAPFVDFVVNAIDGVSRLFRIVATGIAGYTLAIQQALKGDLTGALTTYRAIGDEVEKILLEPLAEEHRRTGQAKTNADARLKIETDLANEIAKLEKLRAVAAGKASADVLKDDKALQRERINNAREATTEQLKGAERLRSALQGAWQESINGARTAREEAAAFFQQAAAAAASRNRQAQDRRDRGLTDEEREAKNTRGARGLADEASRSATFAQNAALDGRTDAARRYAEEALSLAREAAEVAGNIGDNSTAAELLKQIGSAEKAALQAQGKIREQQANDQEAVAQAIEQQIQAAEVRIGELKAELAKPVSIELDITAAEQKIKQLQTQLDRLNGKGSGGEPKPESTAGVPPPSLSGDSDATLSVEADSTQAEHALQKVQNAVDALPEEKVIVVKTISVNGTPTFSDPVSAWNSKQNGYADGGFVSGPGTGTSDSILARLSNGEFVVRAVAVRHYGTGLLDLLNNLELPRLPRFASGGLVRVASSTGSSLAARSPSLSPGLSSGEHSVPAHLVVPGVGQYPIQATVDVVKEMKKAFEREALRSGMR